MMKPIRPSKKAIGEAFGEYTTSCVCGYENTAWDIMQMSDLSMMLDIFSEFDDGDGVYVIEMFEHESHEVMKKMIESYAWRKTK